MSNYEEFNGEIMVYDYSSDAGLSGQSPDWGGGQSASFIIYWKYPVGFNNTEWPDDIDQSAIEEINDNSSLSIQQKREGINKIVYQYGSSKLYSGWDDFYAKYGENGGYGCVHIL